MNNPFRIPFDEVKFSLSNNELSVSSPWVSIEAEIEEGSISSSDLQLPLKYEKGNIQALLEHLQEYCLFYDEPRKNLLKAKDFLEPEVWPFENKDILKYRINRYSYDPITAFQLLQKDSLLQQCETKNNVYKNLELRLKKSPEDFKSSLIFLLNQTYYITENFSKVVHPDKKMAEGLSCFSREIYEEEVGHHKLILQSLKALGADPDLDQVAQPTKDLIQIVSEAFQNSALGFALVNSSLEGNHYPAEDPLSKIIKQSPFKDAAKGIDAHFKINKEANHKDTGLKIAASLTHYLGPEEIFYVINLTKRLQKIFFDIDASFINFIKKE